MRTIKLSIDAGTMTNIGAKIGNRKLFDAIGYLSTWNTVNFDQVEILTGLDELDMMAVYSQSVGTQCYTIVAAWHEDHYGFHS